MEVAIDDLMVWLIVGMLAGSLAGLVVRRKKAGFGKFTNLAVGLVGAIIGGAIFDLLRIDLGLANIAISAQDIVSAFIGSMLFLVVFAYARHWYRARSHRTETLSESQ